MKEFLVKTLKLATDALFNVKVVGDKSHFDQKRLLIIANHPSFLDGILLGLHLPVKPVFLVHTTVKDRPIFRQFAKLAETFEVDPHSPYAIKSIVRLLESGRPVVIFPEGRLTVTGGLMKVYPGAAFAAAKTGATVVSVTIEGAEFSKVSRLQGHLPTRLFPRVTLTINPPFRLEIPEGGTARGRRLMLGEQMRQKLQFALFNKSKPECLYDAFLSGMDLYGADTPILEDVKRPNKPYAYKELFKSIQGLRVLLRPDVEGEKRVGVFLPNVSAAACLVYALNAEGKTACMLNYTSGFESLLHAAQITPVKTIVTSRAFLEAGGMVDLVERLSAEAGIKVVCLEDLAARLTWGKKLAIAALMKTRARVPVEAGSEAVVLYTSGSEGKPKGVVHTNESLIANVWQIRSLIDATPRDKVMMCLPLFHSFGMTSGAIFPLVSGIPVMLYPSPLHYKVIPELVYDKNCTMLFGTNTFLAQYAKQAHHFDFARLRYVVAGAEKLADSTRETYLDKFGIRIMEGYGLTETAPVLAVNTPMAYKKGAVGQFVPGVDYWLEKVDGIEGGGALYVRAPNLMKGYLLTDPTIVPAADYPSSAVPAKTNLPAGSCPKAAPWFKTGDVVEVDEEGFVFIKGRMKRFAKIAGEMVSLETAERLAKASAPGHEHAVVSRSDERKGEALVLFTTDKEMTREKLAAACKSIGASELAVPRRIEAVDKIPLLGTGKTDYVALNLMAAAAC